MMNRRLLSKKWQQFTATELNCKFRLSIPLTVQLPRELVEKMLDFKLSSQQCLFMLVKCPPKF